MTSLLLGIIFLIFISLGLPDGLLGSAWPDMYNKFNVPISYCGIISFTIAVFTIISSLLSDKINKKLNIKYICIISTLLTIIGLLGFSLSNKFYMMIIFAIPYGLGAGSIDAAINNYVAINYKSSHMSFLHCMWGIGASIGPYVMGYALTYNSYNSGYKYIAGIQLILLIIMIISIPIWNRAENNFKKAEIKVNESNVKFKDIFKIKGVLSLLFCFFCYCAIEQTSLLWASSYLVLNNEINVELAASFGSLFLIGITLGRAFNGLLAIRLSDDFLIRIGQIIILIGIILLFIPNINILSFIGLFLIGLGCAPIYPSIMHSIPIRFGKNNSQAIIGLQMGFAYLGTCLMPPLFGIIARNITIKLLPLYLLLILIIMVILHNLCIKLSENHNK